MNPTIAIVSLAALSVVAIPAVALARTCKTVRRKRREEDSALMVEAEGRLSRLVVDLPRSGA